MNVKATMTTLLAALLLALASGPAGAVPIRFEDDDLAFVNDADGSGTVTVGDVFTDIVEVPLINDVPVGPGEELTGVAAFEVIQITDLTGDGSANDVVFGAPTGASPLDFLGFPGAILALWRDATPNLDVVLPGISCATEAECISQAIDGSLFQVDSLAGDPDNHFFSVGSAGLTYSTVVASDPGFAAATVNFGATTVFTGAGHPAVDESVACSPTSIAFGLCGGDDGLVFVGGSGGINGGLGLPASLITDGAFATSDFQFVKNTVSVSVPEPGSLALLAAGLLGLGASLRRRRA